MVEILSKVEKSQIRGNEDMFFATMGVKFPNIIKVAPIEIAVSFAFESDVETCYELNGFKLPFGCHAYQKYNFNFVKQLLVKYDISVNFPQT